MRPNELGKAYFFYEKIIVIEHKNHKDWLIENKIVNPITPSKALFESYKKGYLRLVWDVDGSWSKGKSYKKKTLYINGLEKNVWKNISNIMNHPEWIGLVGCVVIEYLDIVNEKPKWDRYEIVEGKNIENLYKGKKPYKDIAPVGNYLEVY